MAKFLKESFSNGNRYTNILLTVVFLLLSVIGFFLKDLYSDFKEYSKRTNELRTCFEVMKIEQTYIQHQIDKIVEDMRKGNL